MCSIRCALLLITGSLAMLPTGEIYAQTPSVVVTSPVTNELNVAANASISATFDVDMNESTINGASMRAIGNLHGIYAGAVSYNDLTRTAALDPTDTFAAGEVVTVILSEAIESIGGDPLAGGFAWSFTVLASGSGGLVQEGAVPLPKTPAWVRSGDLDSDGDIDLAMASYDADELLICRNNGDGTFAAPTGYPTGSQAAALTVSDLDLDGDLDVAVACINSNDVHLHLNDGAAVFSSGQIISLTGAPRALQCADLDGDGYPDLVISALNPDSVNVLINDGAAQFSEDTGYSIGYGGEDAPYGIALADFDKNGLADLAVAISAHDSLEVNLNDGAGGFLAPVRYSTGNEPYGVLARDLDGDGDLDIATASSSHLNVHLNNGSGSSFAGFGYHVGQRIRDLSSLDIEGDGDLDMLVTQAVKDRVVVLLNNGLADFSSQFSHQFDYEPVSLSVADFDADGKSDLSVVIGAARELLLMMNRMTLTAEPYEIIFYAPANGAAPADHYLRIGSSGIPIPFTANEGADWLTLVPSSGNTPESLTVSVDTTGLGPGTYHAVLEITATDAENSPDSVDVYLNAYPVTAVSPTQYQLNTPDTTDVSATFGFDVVGSSISTATFLVSGQQMGPYTGSVSYDAPSRTALFETNLHFKPGELVTAMLSNEVQSSPGEPLNTSFTWSFSVATQGGWGAFTSVGSYEIGTFNYGVIAADLNADGLPDVITGDMGGTISVMLNAGNAVFQPTVQYHLAGAPQSVSASDLDSDSDLDLLVVDLSLQEVVIWTNDGLGSFARDTSLDLAAGSPHLALGADMDGDGDNDIVTGTTWDAGMMVFLNDGYGVFSEPWRLPLGAHPQTFTVADFDGDGYLDVAAVCYNPAVIAVIFNQPVGDVSAPTHYPLSAGRSNPNAGDLNNDGFVDLAMTSTDTKTVIVMLNNGDGSFAPAVEYAAGSWPRRLDLGDVDSDGDLDIVTSDNPANDIVVFSNDGNGSFPDTLRFPTGGAYPSDLALADFDGDGDVDVAAAHAISEDVTILLNRPCGDADGNAFVNVTDIVFALAYIFAGGQAPHPLLIADASCDGIVNITDGVYLLAYIFASGPAPCENCP